VAARAGLTELARARPSVSAALALALTGLAIAGTVQLVPSLRELVKAARAPAIDQTGARRNAAGIVAGVDAPFADWVAARIRPGASIWIEPGGPGGNAAVYQWLTYRLSPSLHASSARAADVVVFYDVPAKPPPRRGFGALEVFRPHFALMQREPR
jgi:hypothetical protein